MKLQQLRYIWEVAHHDLNVSATAQSLYTSQPGISKQIRLLEDELGVEVFSRSGKHLTRVTPAGEVIIRIAGEILRQVESDQAGRAGVQQRTQGQPRDRDDAHAGALCVAGGHSEIPHRLSGSDSAHEPGHAVCRSRRWRPTAASISGSRPKAVDLFGDLVMMPCYEWNRAVVVPKGHPLIDVKPLTLEAVAAEPIVTYVFGFTGRSRLDDAFVEHGLSPHVVFTATDTDVIKTYVRLGLGVGIVAAMSYDPDAGRRISSRSMRATCFARV